MGSQENLFPKIGDIADQADKLETVTDDPTPLPEEEKVVQEIESLCMKCEEQVRSS